MKSQSKINNAPENAYRWPCPHQHFRSPPVKRDQLSKKDYISLLATPRGYRWNEGFPPAFTGPKTFSVLKPARRNQDDQKTIEGADQRYIQQFLAQALPLMSSEMVNRLKRMLVIEFGMTPRQTEAFIKSRNSKTKSTNQNKVYDIDLCVKSHWLQEFERLLTAKITDYLVSIMGARRSKRVKTIAKNLLFHICGITGEWSNLDNPHNKIQRIQVFLAQGFAVWLANLLEKADKAICEDFNKKRKEEEEEKKRLEDIERENEEEQRRKELEEEDRSKEEELEEQGATELVEEQLEKEEVSEEQMQIEEAPIEETVEESEVEIVEETPEPEEEKEEEEELSAIDETRTSATDLEDIQEEEEYNETESLPPQESEEEEIPEPEKEEEEIIEKLSDIIEESEEPLVIETEAGGDVDTMDIVEDLIEETEPKESDRQKAVSEIIESEVRKSMGDVTAEEEEAIKEISMKTSSFVDQITAEAEDVPKPKGKVTYHVKKIKEGCYYKVKSISENKVHHLTRATRLKKRALLPESICERPANSKPLENSKDIKEWTKWAGGVVELAEKWCAWISQTSAEAQLTGAKRQEKDKGREEHWQKVKRAAEVRSLELRRNKKYVKESSKVWAEKLKNAK